MKNLAKKEEEKEIRNIKLSAGKWFHIEAESLPESSLPKLITGMIVIQVIAGIMSIGIAVLGIDKAASLVRVWWP
ncbi:hypothetical protein [Dyadobacter psychrophilus]|uniref:Uncharacterized protein n=1 Tax=Dyadobacter psychrophilus TaxID=651661 RepID=A0A1T5HGR3_9BACT|nr:hypothetical protein [Dyadobacter psychrophilus]SKC19721.1 hypothetical protein SAMN05660293_05534 [Dyadobacter psychrophilus]